MATSTSLTAQGFHFTLTTHLAPRPHPPADNCTLHLLHALPPDVYADQYELAQRPGLSASSLTGASDLELPVGAVDEGGSLLLLAVPEETQGSGELVFDVPLHARYGRPSLRGGFRTIQLEPPVGFWACPESNLKRPHTELSAHIPQELFPASSIYVVPPAPSAPVLKVIIPVGSLTDLPVVDVGTAVVVLLCFLYLAAVSVQTAGRLSHTPSPRKTE